LAKEVRLNKYHQINEYEEQIGYAIDQEWFHDLALHTQIVVKESPLCYAHGRVLYSALSYYLQQHPPASPTDMVTIWETGTARGFSAICMAKALKDQQRAGTIITFDVLPHRTSMYWNCIDDWDGPKTRVELSNLKSEKTVQAMGSTSLVSWIQVVSATLNDSPKNT